MMNSFQDIAHDHLPDEKPCGICGEGTATKYTDSFLLDSTVMAPCIGYKCDVCGSEFVDSPTSIYNCEVAKSARKLMAENIRGFMPLHIRKNLMKLKVVA